MPADDEAREIARIELPQGSIRAAIKEAEAEYRKWETVKAAVRSRVRTALTEMETKNA